jgi:hypothetical protein
MSEAKPFSISKWEVWEAYNLGYAQRVTQRCPAEA